MSQKRMQQIERRIERSRGRYGRSVHASGFADPPIQGPPTPHRGLLADQLYRQMKSRTEYVRKEYVKEVRRQTVTHKRFKRLVDQWIDLSIEHSRLTMQIAKPTASR